MVRSWVGAAGLLLRLGALALFFVVEVVAQDPLVTRADPASWVQKQTYDPASLDGKPTSGPAYLLIARQRLHNDTEEQYYSRYVSKINDISSAEEVSQLSISFDPAYERLIFHHITVIRGGISQDRLDMGAFKILQKEDEADRLIFNGSVTASLVLADIRPGDILDYAYTIRGKNPVFFDHVSDRVSLNYSVPIGKYYVSFDVPNDRPYQTAGYADAPEPEQTEQAGRRRFIWDQINIAGHRADDDVPAWHKSNAFFEVTDQTNWTQLGQLYTPYYQVPDQLSDALAAEIDKIASDHETPEGRIRAALAFVQRNIRYLGLEGGMGGYAPRDPSLVLDQRFGDCKDKTMVLATILNRLGIRAKPLLVDTEIHAQFQRHLPSAYTFDHVITLVSLAGRTLWLDPTQDDQTGDLSNMQQANFGAGLLVDGDNSTIVEFKEPDTPPSVTVIETYDVVKEHGAVFMTVESVFWGNRADRLIKTLVDDGIEGLQANYLEYYQANYPSITVEQPLTFRRDDKAGTVTISESYKIPDAWAVDEDDGARRFLVWPGEVSDVLPDADMVPRTSPLDLAWPSTVHHELRFIVDDTWSFNEETITLDNDVFSFSKASQFSGNVYSEKYVYVGKKDYADVEELAQFNADAQIADGEDGVELYQHGPGVDLEALATEFEETVEIISYITVGGFALFIIFVFIKAVSFDAGWRTDALYYPISVTKFVVLYISTFGAYSFFWAYKNWQWVRDGEGKAVMPFWRAVFLIITNFSLFSRIAHAGPDGGSRLLQWLYAPAAFTIMIVEIVTNSADRVEAIPDWVFLFQIVSMLVTIPFVQYIRAINAENSNVVAKNSEFTWHSWVAVGVGVLVWSFILFGLFMA